MEACYYIDTSFFLAYAEPRNPFYERARELASSLREKRHHLVTSVFTRAELYSVIARSLPALGMEQVYGLAIKLINDVGVDIVDADMNEAVKEASLYVARLRLPLPQAIQLALTIAVGCTHLVSFDTALLEKSHAVKQLTGVSIVW